MRWALLFCVLFAVGFVLWAVWPTPPRPAQAGASSSVPTASNQSTPRIPRGASSHGAPRRESTRGYGQEAVVCMGNLHQLALSISSYAADSDEMLPRAAEWSDELKTYFSKIEEAHCPAVREYGYAFHRSLGAVSTAANSASGSTPVVFDSSHLAPNANDDMTSLPKPPRHADRVGGRGDLGSFLDGHADWVHR